MDKAELEFETDNAEIAIRVSTRFLQIYRFRTAMQVGLKGTTEAVFQHSSEVVQAVATDLSTSPGTRVDPGLLEALTSRSFAQADADAKVADLLLAVDAASLIFAHSIMDGTAYDLCVWVAQKAPHAWEEVVADKQVPLRETKAKGYDAVLRERVTKYVSNLEHQSLLTKINLLMQVCKPTPEEISATGFRPDRDKLAELDQRRHDVVHHGASSPLPEGEDDLDFLFEYTKFVYAIARKRFSARQAG